MIEGEYYKIKGNSMFSPLFIVKCLKVVDIDAGEYTYTFIQLYRLNTGVKFTAYEDEIEVIEHLLEHEAVLESLG